MSKIITISRQFGSGGRAIGKQVAEQLEIPFYDKAIVGKVAEETGLSRDFIEKKGEYSPTKGFFSYGIVGRDSTGASLDDHLYFIQQEIIEKWAQKGPCVIVGRCADYILRDRTDCIHVYISGNEQTKCERIQKVYGKTEAEALKLMKETDKKRRLHYDFYTDQKWGYAGNYTLCLNSSEIGYNKCVEMIVDLAK